MRSQLVKSRDLSRRSETKLVLYIKTDFPLRPCQCWTRPDTSGSFYKVLYMSIEWSFTIEGINYPDVIVECTENIPTWNHSTRAESRQLLVWPKLAFGWSAVFKPQEQYSGRSHLTLIISAIRPSREPAWIFPSESLTSNFPRAIWSMKESSGWCICRSGFGLNAVWSKAAHREENRTVNQTIAVNLNSAWKWIHEVPQLWTITPVYWPSF